MEVYNSFKGTLCKIKCGQSTSFDDFREKLCRDEGIDEHNILLLSAPTGVPAKSLNNTRVFVYDNKWVQNIDLQPNAGTDSEIGNSAVCDEASNLAVSHLNHNLSIVSKTIRKYKNIYSQLAEDVLACSDWHRYYDALEQVPELKGNLSTLLDVDVIEKCSTELSTLWSSLSHEFKSLEADYEELKQLGGAVEEVSTHTLKEGQQKLIETLKTVSNIQLRIKSRLKQPLSNKNTQFKRVEDLKATVAKVIDIPFLYGVLLIESARRRKWSEDLSPIWNQEISRRADWCNHYCTGSVGTLVERLDNIGKLNIVGEKNLANTVKIDSDRADNSDVLAYLQNLEALNLHDVCKDLRSELGAMKRQFARSMSASISLLVPGNIHLGSTTNGRVPFTQSQSQSHQQQLAVPPTAIAAYESRIRKLETILMQSKLSSKTHELELIRAETRAEARAEARAEVKAEQQQLRIAELEKINEELASRLQSYIIGLEATLNSIGLQTSRVDPETGVSGSYSVNRVKGLSRNATAPPQPTQDLGDGSSGRSGSSSDSTTSKHIERVSSNTTESSTRTTSVERILEQTFIDNKVLFEAVSKRFGDVERLARKFQVENRRLQERDTKLERDLRQRVALHSFQPEDLILFLPTRDTRRQPNPWAAFNAGAPHYFLHPDHTQQLQNREYLIARASGIERKVAGNDEENIFQLPVGVEWFLISVHSEWAV